MLILSFDDNIKIYKINSLKLVNIQTISNQSYCINFDKNVFIAYDKFTVSLYKKINGIKCYQLLSKFKFEKRLIKLLKFDI